MPLSERARIELYLPDRPDYEPLRDRLVLEFTRNFGGCTEIPGVRGHYFSRAGEQVNDRINLLYVDTPLSWDSDAGEVAAYADELRQIVFDELQEEAIYVTAYRVQLSTGSYVQRDA